MSRPPPGGAPYPSDLPGVFPGPLPWAGSRPPDSADPGVFPEGSVTMGLRALLVDGNEPSALVTGVVPSRVWPMPMTRSFLITLMSSAMRRSCALGAAPRHARFASSRGAGRCDRLVDVLLPAPPSPPLTGLATSHYAGDTHLRPCPPSTRTMPSCAGQL